MPKPTKGLASRFELASEDVNYRTIASIEGEVGTGKTYFGFTGPAPVLSQNIDQGTEGVVEQFRKEGKEVYEEKYVWTPGEIEDGDLQDAAIEIRDKWEADFDYAVDNGARTIIWDTESRIWQVYRYAEFGAPNADSPRDYDTLNQRFESRINKAKSIPNVNLFLIRSMKDHWGMVGPVNKQTGKKGFGKSGREVWGYEHLPGIVFTELRFFYDTDAKEYMIQVGKCRHNASLQFDTVPRCTFPQFGTLLVSDTDESDWE